MGLSKPALSRPVAFFPPREKSRTVSNNLEKQSWRVGGEGDSGSAVQNMKAPNCTRTCSEEVLGRGAAAQVGWGYVWEVKQRRATSPCWAWDEMGTKTGPGLGFGCEEVFNCVKFGYSKLWGHVWTIAKTQTSLKIRKGNTSRASVIFYWH